MKAKTARIIMIALLVAYLVLVVCVAAFGQRTMVYKIHFNDLDTFQIAFADDTAHYTSFIGTGKVKIKKDETIIIATSKGRTEMTLKYYPQARRREIYINR